MTDGSRTETRANRQTEVDVDHMQEWLTNWQAASSLRDVGELAVPAYVHPLVHGGRRDFSIGELEIRKMMNCYGLLSVTIVKL